MLWRIDKKNGDFISNRNQFSLLHCIDVGYSLV